MEKADNTVVTLYILSSSRLCGARKHHCLKWTKRRKRQEKERLCITTDLFIVKGGNKGQRPINQHCKTGSPGDHSSAGR